MPDICDHISHSLCYGELVFQDGYAIKDLSFLAENRTQNLTPDNEDEEPVPSEIMVIDTLDGANASDPQTINYI